MTSRKQVLGRLGNDSTGNELNTHLAGIDRQDYPSEYHAHTLEQYKLCVEMADRISRRRQVAHAFFLSVNAGLIALLGWALPADAGTLQSVWLVIVGLAGTVLSGTWLLLIRSYRNLNRAKFSVIQQMEMQLPLKPFTAEWELVGRGADSALYRPFTRIEPFVPTAFILLYVALIAVTILNALDIL